MLLDILNTLTTKILPIFILTMKKKLIPTLLFAMLPITLVIPSGMSATTSSKISQPEIVMCQEVQSIEPNIIPTPVAQPIATPTQLEKELTQPNNEPANQPTPKPGSEAPTVSVSVAVAVAVAAVTPVAPEQLESLFEQYATEYGISSSTLKIIAKCESGFNPAAQSKNGLYGGMFQFSATTWASTRRAMGLDENPELRFNAEEAIRTTAFKIAHGGIGAWPHCGKKRH